MIPDIIPIPVLPVNITNITEMFNNTIIGGLLYGMTEDNQLQEVQNCIDTGLLMYEEYLWAQEHLATGTTPETTMGLLELGIVGLQVSQLTTACQSIGDDFKALEDWAEIFNSPAKLVGTIFAHKRRHAEEMEADWQAFKDFNATGDFWKAGHALADWATVAIGPV
jgi:hypothetical protein